MSVSNTNSTQQSATVSASRGDALRRTELNKLLGKIASAHDRYTANADFRDYAEILYWFAELSGHALAIADDQTHDPSEARAGMIKDLQSSLDQYYGWLETERQKFLRSKVA